MIERGSTEYNEILKEDRVRPPMHPGRILELEWLEPLGMNSRELAEDLGVPRDRIYRVVSGKQAMTADTALRLSVWSGMRPEFWLGLQTDYDLQMVEWKEREEIERAVRPLAKGRG